jgi:hypothetical protein
MHPQPPTGPTAADHARAAALHLAASERWLGYALGLTLRGARLRVISSLGPVA